jgi:hypothetical protein
MSEYGRRIIVNRSFDRTVWLAVEGLSSEGFVLKSTDVTRLVKAGASRELRRYVLIDAIHPELTWEALKLDLDVGVIMPCRIAIYELADGETAVLAGELMGAAGDVESWRRAHPDLMRIVERLDSALAGALRRVSQARPRPRNAA